MSVSIKYTYQDLLTIPEDRNRYELLDGDLIVTPAPSKQHQQVAGNCYIQLRAHTIRYPAYRDYIAPCDVFFSEETVVQPDLFVVESALDSETNEKAVTATPALIVEVISPSTVERDRGYKFKLYAQEGVREYWLADPETRALEVYTLRETGYQLLGAFKEADTVRSEVFPDLAFQTDELWM